MKWFSGGLQSIALLFAALPATVNYQLNSYGFGAGGAANAGTATYSLEGTAGELAGAAASTTTYTLKPGFVQTQQANVPKLASLTNGSGTYYNMLHFVLDTQNNPTDALYALSVSTDNFVSDIRYVKSDMTVGSSLAVADYKTYSGFSGASGANIIGLNPNTTYYVRAKVTQGKYTESAYGPALSAATVGAQLSFSLSTTTVSLGTLLPATVVSGAQPVNVTFATNAASGGDVYISGQYGGLHSNAINQTIPAVSGDLSGLTRGFGARVSSVSATSGTLSSLSPFNGSGTTVGLFDTTIRRIITASGPVSGGAGSVVFQAKSAATDMAAVDYKEVSTMLASANF